MIMRYSHENTVWLTVSLPGNKLYLVILEPTVLVFIQHAFGRVETRTCVGKDKYLP